MTTKNEQQENYNRVDRRMVTACTPALGDNIDGLINRDSYQSSINDVLFFNLSNTASSALSAVQGYGQGRTAPSLSPNITDHSAEPSSTPSHTSFSGLNLNSVDEEDKFLYGESNSFPEEQTSVQKHTIISNTGRLDTGWSDEEDLFDEAREATLNKLNSRLKKNLPYYDSQNKFQDNMKVPPFKIEEILIEDTPHVAEVHEQRYVSQKLEHHHSVSSPVFEKIEFPESFSSVKDKSKYHIAAELLKKRNAENKNAVNISSSEKLGIFPGTSRNVPEFDKSLHEDLKTDKPALQRQNTRTINKKHVDNIRGYVAGPQRKRPHPPEEFSSEKHARYETSRSFSPSRRHSSHMSSLPSNKYRSSERDHTKYESSYSSHRSPSFDPEKRPSRHTESRRRYLSSPKRYSHSPDYRHRRPHEKSTGDNKYKDRSQRSRSRSPGYYSFKSKSSDKKNISSYSKKKGKSGYNSSDSFCSLSLGSSSSNSDESSDEQKSSKKPIKTVPTDNKKLEDGMANLKGSGDTYSKKSDPSKLPTDDIPEKVSDIFNIDGNMLDPASIHHILNAVQPPNKEHQLLIKILEQQHQFQQQHQIQQQQIQQLQQQLQQQQQQLLASDSLAYSPVPSASVQCVPPHFSPIIPAATFPAPIMATPPIENGPYLQMSSNDSQYVTNLASKSGNVRPDRTLRTIPLSDSLPVVPTSKANNIVIVPKSSSLLQPAKIQESKSSLEYSKQTSEKKTINLRDKGSEKNISSSSRHKQNKSTSEHKMVGNSEQNKPLIIEKFKKMKAERSKALNKAQSASEDLDQMRKMLDTFGKKISANEKVIYSKCKNQFNFALDMASQKNKEERRADENLNNFKSRLPTVLQAEVSKIRLEQCLDEPDIKEKVSCLDQGDHLCSECCLSFNDIKEMLNHIQTAEHKKFFNLRNTASSALSAVQGYGQGRTAPSPSPNITDPSAEPSSTPSHTSFSGLNLSSVDEEDEFLYGEANSFPEEQTSVQKNTIISNTGRLDTGWSDEEDLFDEAREATLNKLNSRLKKNLPYYDSQNKFQDNMKVPPFKIEEILIEDTPHVAEVHEQRYVSQKLEHYHSVSSPVFEKIEFPESFSSVKDKSKYHIAAELLKKRNAENKNAVNISSSEKLGIFPGTSRNVPEFDKSLHEDLKTDKPALQRQNTRTINKKHVDNIRGYIAGPQRKRPHPPEEFSSEKHARYETSRSFSPSRRHSSHMSSLPSNKYRSSERDHTKYESSYSSRRSPSFDSEKRPSRYTESRRRYLSSPKRYSHSPDYRHRRPQEKSTGDNKYKDRSQRSRSRSPGYYSFKSKSSDKKNISSYSKKKVKSGYNSSDSFCSLSLGSSSSNSDESSDEQKSSKKPIKTVPIDNKKLEDGMANLKGSGDTYSKKSDPSKLPTDDIPEKVSDIFNIDGNMLDPASIHHILNAVQPPNKEHQLLIKILEQQHQFQQQHQIQQLQQQLQQQQQQLLASDSLAYSPVPSASVQCVPPHFSPIIPAATFPAPIMATPPIENGPYLQMSPGPSNDSQYVTNLASKSGNVRPDRTLRTIPLSDSLPVVPTSKANNIVIVPKSSSLPQPAKIQESKSSLQSSKQTSENKTINLREKGSEKNISSSSRPKESTPEQNRSTSEHKKVNETNDDALDIDSLPNEVMAIVFSYLKQNQLGQIARVCRKWNVLTKIPGLWKKVNVKLFIYNRSQIPALRSFINGLPSCVTSIRLNFTKYKNQTLALNFENFFEKLQEKCPHLDELMLTNSEISDSLPSIIVLCCKFFPNLKNLIFHRCTFSGNFEREFCGTSDIVLLDLSWCRFKYTYPPQFSRMPNLKVLSLFGTNASDMWITADPSYFKQLHVLNVAHTSIDPILYKEIQINGLNLKELYLCSIDLEDNFFNFETAFPHLQIICFGDSYMTCDILISFIQSCPSLQNVYVNKHVAKSFAAHPFVVANICKVGIVKAIDWCHIHKVKFT